MALIYSSASLGGLSLADLYPYSESFQLKILALISRDKAAYISFQDIIKPKYFRKEIHIDMCRIIHDYYDQEMKRSRLKGTEVNAPTLTVLWEEARKLYSSAPKKIVLKTQYEDCVADIVEIDLSDAEYIKDNIVAFGRRSALEHAILESVEDIEKNVEDFSGIEERIKLAIRVGEDISDLGVNYFTTAESRTKDYAAGTDGVKRIPTGMSGLDRVLKGGLGVGELGVVIAPPNRGKSFALVNIGAGAVLEGYNVVHYTLEMPEKQVARRYDSKMTKKNFQYMKDNADKTLTALMNIHKFHKGDLIIKKYKTSECTVNTIRSHLTRLHAETGFKPDLIIVDYGDLVQSRKSYSDKRFELESVYLDLRDLGDEFQCPVWTASQANRGALDKKTITIADLAEAFNKANIADFMCALCQTVEEKEEGSLRWHIAKWRDGEANITLEGDIDYETATMTAIYVDTR